MKQIIAVLLFACGLATAQVNPPTIWRSSRTAPSGNCPAGTGVETIPGGVLYTCQNGTWTQISGGGGSSIAPFTTDGTNVTLPSGTLSVSGSVTGSSVSTTGSPSITMGTGQGFAGNEGTAPTAGLPAAGVDGCYYDSTAHGILCSFNGAAFFPVKQTIATGTTALSTGALAGNTCSTAVDVTATGVLTTDRLTWTPSADWSGLVGYGILATDGLKVYMWLTAGAVHWKVCNGTAVSITVPAASVVWGVAR